jgi:hypothetical protein
MTLSFFNRSVDVTYDITGKAVRGDHYTAPEYRYLENIRYYNQDGTEITQAVERLANIVKDDILSWTHEEIEQYEEERFN